MADNRVIVESPDKADDQEVSARFRRLASYGHVRDLVPKEAQSSARTP
jgi:DNA topoisomerase IA